MTNDEVRQILLDAIGTAAPKVASTGQGSGEAIHHLTEAWAILDKSVHSDAVRERQDRF